MHSSLLESASSPTPNARIWSADLDALSDAQIEELEGNLDATERARAARFHFARDRKHFVATRGLLRVLLATLLRGEAREISFAYGAHGKPALASAHEGDLRFNLAHAQGRAIFAVAHALEVGIDLEAADRLPVNEEHLASLATRILSQSELPVWRALPDLQTRQHAFLRAWTRKEACVKASGRGLFSGLQEIEVALDAAAPAGSLTIRGPRAESGLTSFWIVHDLVAPPRFCAALAVEEKSELPHAEARRPTTAMISDA